MSTCTDHDCQVGGWVDHFTYDLRGSLDIPRLERACQKLLSHHAILRTVFVEYQGQKHQLILHEAPFNFNIHHVKTSPELDELSQHLYAKDGVIPSGSPIVRFDLHLHPR